MIHAVLIFNNSGRPRLSRFYTPLAGGSGAEQRALRLIYSLVSRRPDKAANFADAPELEPLLASFVGAGPPAAAPKPVPFDDADVDVDVHTGAAPAASTVDTCPLRIIYRQFATLYFVFVVDAAESELGILDLIQVFVEALDRMFTSVCELDLVFAFDRVHALLGEMIQGGIVVETNMNELVRQAQAVGAARVESAKNIPGSAAAVAAAMPGSVSGFSDMLAPAAASTWSAAGNAMNWAFGRR